MVMVLSTGGQQLQTAQPIADDAEDDQQTRHHERLHVGDLEGLDEVAPLRIGGPGEALRQRSGRLDRHQEDADEG